MQQEVRVMVVPSPTGNRKVAQQEVRVMVVPSPKQATARWRRRK